MLYLQGKLKIMKIILKDMHEGICLMSISGRIDSNYSGDLENSLNRAINDYSGIIVDLKDTEYISSSGMRVLLAGKKMLGEKNGEMILTSLQPVVRDVFEIAGLARLFLIKKSWEDAFSEIICRP
jgi:anti-sigma B factor antagonist